MTTTSDKDNSDNEQIDDVNYADASSYNNNVSVDVNDPILNIDRKKFKKVTTGAWITESLFLERRYKKELAVFTFRDEDRVTDHGTYYSLSKRYITLEDPTEYDFACTYVGGWKHWKQMLKNPWILKNVTQWREELELKLRARGIRGMINEATLGGRSQAAAARWLAENRFTVTVEKKAKSTTHSRVTTKMAPVETEINKDLMSDLKRLNLAR